MLKISDIARDKLNEFMKDHPDKCLRLVLEGIG
jgi:Fe-S cluster assembly iron-binding protein IscA